MNKTIAVVYVDSTSSRTYDYLVHPSVGEVKVGDVLYAEARDTVSLVEVKSVHVIPSHHATKYAFQKVTLGNGLLIRRPTHRLVHLVQCWQKHVPQVQPDSIFRHDCLIPEAW